jgi:hypothetical protein
MGGVGGWERESSVSSVSAFERRLECAVAGVAEEEVELFPVKMDLGEFIEMVRWQCAKGGKKSGCRPQAPTWAVALDAD